MKMKIASQKLSGTMKAVPRGTFRNKDIHLKQSSPTYLNVTSQCSEKNKSNIREVDRKHNHHGRDQKNRN